MAHWKAEEGYILALYVHPPVMRQPALYAARPFVAQSLMNLLPVTGSRVDRSDGDAGRPNRGSNWLWWTLGTFWVKASIVNGTRPTGARRTV